MRRLIKRLERSNVSRLLDEVGRPSWLRGRTGWNFTGGGLRRQLGRRVTERGEAAADAIHQATGVYFPNRIHRARIAVKKLRYADEIAHVLGLATGTPAIRDLRKAQDLLVS